MSAQWQVFFSFWTTGGKAPSIWWQVLTGPHCLSIMSSIVGPPLDSVLPITILSMDAAMILRYMAPVESSRTTLPVFIWETLDVILPTADISVEVLPLGCTGSDISILTTVSMKLWVGVVDCLTTSAPVSGNAGMEGAPGEWVDGRLKENEEGLLHNLGTPVSQGIPMAVVVFSCPSVGEPSTWLNMVAGGHQQLSMGLSISTPSKMSHLVMVTNSPMAWHSSLTLSAKGRASGLAGRYTFSAQCCRHWQ